MASNFGRLYNLVIASLLVYLPSKLPICAINSGDQNKYEVISVKQIESNNDVNKYGIESNHL